MCSSQGMLPPSHGKIECEQDSSDSESELNYFVEESSSTGTLDSFVPDTMSPIPSKHRSGGTKNLKFKAGSMGSKNATINLHNSSNTVVHLGTVLKNNKETHYRMPIMEKEVEEGRTKTSDKRKMHNDKALKTEKAGKKYQSAFEFLVETMEKMDAKLMRTKEKKDMWKEKCDKLHNDLENQKMINLISLNHACQSCEKRSMQEIATNKEVIEMLTIKNGDLAAQLKHEQETNTSKVEQLNAEREACEKTVCEKESENKAMQAWIKSLEREVDGHKQQLLDYKEHVITVAEQRRDENETYTLTVSNLENKLAELEQQILDYKEHALTVTKQRKDENEAYTSTVNNLERKCAELKQQLLDYEEHVVTVTKQRKDENETYTSTVKRLEDRLAELEQQYKHSEEQRLTWMENAEELAHERNCELASNRRLQKELVKKDSALKSCRIICKNRKNICAGLCRIIDQLEGKISTTNARMNAVMVQLATLTTRSNNLRIHNFMLQDLVNMLERRVEAFEGREEDHGVLREALLQMLNDLRNPPQAVDQLANAEVVNDPQLPQQAVLPQADITALHCQSVSGVHTPD